MFNKNSVYLLYFKMTSVNIPTDLIDILAAPTEEDINAARNAVLDALEAVSARGG
jgi:hypothetical protein